MRVEWQAHSHITNATYAQEFGVFVQMIYTHHHQRFHESSIFARRKGKKIWQNHHYFKQMQKLNEHTMQLVSGTCTFVLNVIKAYFLF